MTDRHSLSNRDDVNLTATCSICGPVTTNRVINPKKYVSYRCGQAKKNYDNTKGKHHNSHGYSYEQTRDIKKGKSCAICGSEMDLRIDHDHDSKERRGILCNTHNLGLSMFHDSIQELQIAIQYLSTPGFKYRPTEQDDT